jgi:hypothetical protein
MFELINKCIIKSPIWDLFYNSTLYHIFTPLSIVFPIDFAKISEECGLKKLGWAVREELTARVVR